MTGFRLRTVAVLMVSAIAFMGSGVSAAHAAPKTRSVSWLGTYDMYVTWTGHPTGLFSFTLGAHHSGSDDPGDTVTWKKSGRMITITFASDLGSATYVGKKTKFGFNTKKKQGTSSSTSGSSGTWYAIV